MAALVKLYALAQVWWQDSTVQESKPDTTPVADLEMWKGGLNPIFFFDCHAHFRSRWQSELNI